MTDALGDPQSAIPNATAWVFPGQGSQAVGMGRQLYEELPAVRAIYDEADEVLGFPLSRLCFEGPEEELNRTVNAQPALLTTSYAHLLALHERELLLTAPRFVAGHSLGEYSALLAAGAWSFPTALRLVRARGEAMQAASDAAGDCGMVAVIGANNSLVAEICAECDIDLANYNAPGQAVISGPRAGLDQAVSRLKESGIRRVVPLAVSVASHSRLMRPAAERMTALLADVEIRPPDVPAVANVTAQPTSDTDEIRRLLVEQLYSPVQWIDSMLFMSDTDVTTFWEIGPGKVLSGLIKRILPQATLEQSETHL